MGQAPGTGQVSLRTFPRNFPGRSGTIDDKVYLCSPETAAAAALKGVITDPRDLGSEMSYPRIGDPEKYIIDESSIIFPTDEGRKTLKGKPSRIQEVNKEIESMGARVVGQWAVLGPYDFVNVVEAPDNQTVARVSVELGARGTVQIITLPAIPIEEFQARLRG